MKDAMNEQLAAWEGLSPPYATIVADPPWSYDEGWAPFGPTARFGDQRRRRPMRYSTLSVEQIAALPVGALADTASHLFLWTTNRYVRDAYEIVAEWGFRSSQLLTWCKAPMGIGPGGAFSITTEFVLYARRGSGSEVRRTDSTWWQWKRPYDARGKSSHSSKPPAFFDLVESVTPGPYVELFARQQRLGWDAWGYGYEAAS